MAGQNVCLDIGESYIKVIDVEAKKKSLKLESAGFNEIPFNLFSVTSQEYAAKASELIRKLVADAEIKKSDANIIIPDSQTYTRIFDMPLLTDKELVSAIRYQADQFIPVPIDQVSLDIHIIHKDKKADRSNILLVAATNAVINHVVKIAEDAALMPLNIENETSAVLRLITQLNDYRAEGDTASGGELYINFGNSSSSIYLFDVIRNIPLQVHNFAIGQHIFYKDIKANYMLNDDQIKDLIERIGFTGEDSQYKLDELLASPLNEFVSEIQRFIMSSKEQNASDIKKISVFGEGSKFAGITEKMAEMLKLPVQLMDVHGQFEKSNVADFFKEDWPLLVPAIGGSLL